MPGPVVKCATVFVSGRFASQFAIKALSCLIPFSVMSASVLISLLNALLGLSRFGKLCQSHKLSGKKKVKGTLRLFAPIL